MGPTHQIRDNREDFSSLDHSHRLLLAISHVQSQFIVDANPAELFDNLLNDLLELTDSQYGFIGEVLYADGGAPYLKTHAITNIAWNEKTRRFYADNFRQGLEFTNLNTLFGAVMASRQPVIANSPATDLRRGGLPEGHPPLNAFLGVPFSQSGELIGMVGIANRPGGYDHGIVDFLDPFLATCANIVAAYRNDRRRQEVEEALRHSEAKLRATFETVVDGIITINEAGIITAVNPAAEQLFGYASGQLAGRNVQEVMPEPYASEHADYVQRYLETGQPRVIGRGREVVGRHKDGTIIPLQLSVGECSRRRRMFTGVVRDLTAVKRQQRAANLAKFSVDRAGDAVFWIAPDARLQYVNDAACRNLQYSRRQLLKMTVFDIDCTMTPNVWDLHWDQLRQQRTLTIESVHRRRNGSRFPVEVSVNYIDLEGEAFNCAIVRDISERKKVETALRESEARKSAILESALDCVITINEQGHIVEFNPAAEHTFGYRRSEVLGEKMAELVVPALFRDQHYQGLAHYMATGQGPVLGKRIELRAMHADGTEFPVEISITPIEIDERRLFTAYLRDITERKKGEEALREARDAAEAASRFKSEFLASMSHEIRTPMTAIVGYADLLARQTNDPPQQQEWSTMLRRSADYLLALVNDVLDLSKIEAGQIDLHFEATELSAIIDDVVSLFRPAAKEKLLELHVEFLGRVPRLINVDGIRFKQILVNLVSNAIKFTEQGSVRIQVRLIDSDLPGNVRLAISVIDTGLGIKPETLDRLFEPFTGAKWHEFGGTGLGLTISRHFARLLSGDIDVQSAVGKGSTFTLRLDLGPREIIDLREPLQADRKVSSRSRTEPLQLEGMHILIVDDNVHNQTIAKYLLAETAACVTTAGDGVQAVSLVTAAADEGQPFDLILMDMRMPVMDGYDATTELRKRGIRTPIVALTAYAMSGDEEKCRTAGCDAYLAKPIVPAFFYDTIARFLCRERWQSVPMVEPKVSQVGTSSNLAIDEDFAPVRQRYISKLPGIIRQLLAARDANDVKTLRELAHRVKGTAG